MKKNLLFILCLFSINIFLSNAVSAQTCDNPPTVTCAEFSMTYSDCPDGLGPNTPDGVWYPIGPSGGINNAVGGSYTLFLDLSTCVTDDCTTLAAMEYTLAASYSEDVVPGCSITLVNEWSIRDSSGNVSPDVVTFKGTIAFDGTTPPSITCPANVNVECGDPTDPSATGEATATSDCGTPSITFTDASTPGCGGTEVITRTWIATDGCGTTSTCDQIITTVDTTPPTITCAMGQTVECGDAIVIETPTASDDCDPAAPIITFTDASVPGCGNTEVITRTWTATDACGNMASCNEVITIVDTTPPDVTCAEFSMTFEACPDPIFPNTPNGSWVPVPPSGTFLTAVGGSFIQEVDINNCVTDNCSAIGDLEWTLVSSYEENRVPGCSVDIINELGIRDACENQSMTTIIVRSTLQFDGPAPVIVCPANVDVECGDPTDPSATGMATATSDCGTPTVTFSDVSTPACGGTEIITRTWTATDGCGTTSTCDQIITVVDTQEPRFADPDDEVINTSTAGIVCPYPDATISLVADPDHANPLTPGSDFMVHGATFQVPTDFDDSCDPNPQIYVNIIREEVNSMSNEPCTRVIRVVWSVEDGCGNERLRRQLFTINDDVAPVPPMAPADVMAQCAADVPAPVDLTAVDACQGDITVSPSAVITPGGCPNSFTEVRTWTFIDDCGNESSVSQTIIINDDTPPVAPAPPADVMVQCAVDVPAPEDLTAVDNCDGDITVAPSAVITPGGCPNSFTEVRTWTFVDDCGNESSVSQTITVNDDTPPVLTLPVDLTLSCGSDTSPDATGSATAVDNCDGDVPTTSSDVSDVTQCDGGTILRTWTATDACGNSDSQVQTITVLPPGGPMVTCPADMTVECFEDIVADPANLIVVTECGLGFTAYVKQPLITGGIPGCDGTVYTYIYKAVDDCGRVGQCEQVFTIENDAPVVTVPAGTTVECFSDIEVDESDATVVVACSDQSVNIDVLGPVVNGPMNCPGTTYTYTYQVKDNCGRIVLTERVFTNGQNAGPTIQAPVDMQVTCMAGVNLNPENAIVSTTCGDSNFQVEVTGPQIIGAMDCNGTRYLYTYTVTDECGRTASDIRTFTVNNEGPQFTGCEEDTWLQYNCEDFGGEAGTIAAIEAYIASVEAYSACGDQLTVFNNFNANNINTCINNGINTITFRATDNCGTTTFCTTTYVVVDTEAPTIFEEAEDHWEICNYNSPQNFQNWVNNHGGAEAYDGCSSDNVFWSTIPSNPSFNCSGASGVTSTTVTFVVRDNCGNSTSTTATFNAFAGGFVSQGGTVENGDEEFTNIELFQNRPNPFKEQTVVGFNLPKAQNANLAIYDLSGRLLKTYEGDFAEGYNEVTVNRSELPSTGVLIYRLTTDTDSATRKMIMTE